jgi:putative sterol carrier protein
MTKELYPKWLDSDLVVYASPLYHFTMNATMKAFIERTLPVLEPFFLGDGDGTRHPLRHEHPKMVFLSVAGFPELSVFDQLSSWANSVYGRHNMVVAEIYRPAAEILNVPFYREKAEDILDATTQGGREIVESMKISPETMTRITQDIAEDTKVLHRMGNLMWKACISEGVTPKEMRESKITPRPESVEDFMGIMEMGFKKETAGDTKAVLQFRFSDEVEGACYFSIENGMIHAALGVHESPELVVETPFGVWMDILTGKTDGQQMFMEQKYKVHGDLSLLMKMNQLFG